MNEQVRMRTDEVAADGTERFLTMRRALLKLPAAAAVALSTRAWAERADGADAFEQTVVVYRHGDVFQAMGMIDRKSMASDRSASKTIQPILDMFEQSRGGKLVFEPGVYLLDRPLRIPSNTSLQGSGASTILRVTNENREGIGILSDFTSCISISDLCVDGDLWANKASVSGIVLDNCLEASVDNVACQNFNQYGIHLSNLCGLCRVHNCTASNNQLSNFFLDYVSRPWASSKLNDSTGPVDTFPEPFRERIANIIPNLITDCYAFGGGNGFDISNSLCQDLVGCMVYQPGGVAFYVHHLSDSTLISGCRSFQAEKQAVLVEDSSEINISSSIFCWQKENGVELKNCTWGSISANEIIDSGASSVDGGKCSLYMHTDVKGIQVSGNAMWNWPDQVPLLAGVFEDDTCQDISITSNYVNHFTGEAVMVHGGNTLVASNHIQKKAYAVPKLQPFSRRSPNLRMVPPFERTQLEDYFKARE